MLRTSARCSPRPRWLPAFFGDGGLMQFPERRARQDGPMTYADVGAALEQSMVVVGRLQVDSRGLERSDRRQGRPHRGRCAPGGRRQGAAAIVVSNHGGRQLDGVAPTLRVLPEVVAAVGGQTEVLLDGGIRRGSDIVKALCLGARAVLIGRALRLRPRRRRRGRA